MDRHFLTQKINIPPKRDGWIDMGLPSPHGHVPWFLGGSVPPLYFAVGASESILGDSVRVAQHAAQGGADVILEAAW